MKRLTNLITLFFAVFTISGMCGANALEYSVKGPGFAALPVYYVTGSGEVSPAGDADERETAKLVADSALIDFHTVPAGGTSVPVTLELSNTGSDDVMAVILEASEGFTLSDAYPFEPVLIKAGNSTTITLAYYNDAATAAPLSGYLYVRTLGGGNETLQVPMVANGATAPTTANTEGEETEIINQNIGVTAGPCFIGITGR